MDCQRFRSRLHIYAFDSRFSNLSWDVEPLLQNKYSFFSETVAQKYSDLTHELESSQNIFLLIFSKKIGDSNFMQGSFILTNRFSEAIKQVSKAYIIQQERVLHEPHLKWIRGRAVPIISARSHYAIIAQKTCTWKRHK